MRHRKLIAVALVLLALPGKADLRGFANLEGLAAPAVNASAAWRRICRTRCRPFA